MSDKEQKLKLIKKIEEQDVTSYNSYLKGINNLRKSYMMIKNMLLKIMLQAHTGNKVKIQ